MSTFLHIFMMGLIVYTSLKGNCCMKTSCLHKQRIYIPAPCPEHCPHKKKVFPHKNNSSTFWTSKATPGGQGSGSGRARARARARQRERETERPVHALSKRLGMNLYLCYQTCVFGSSSREFGRGLCLMKTFMQNSFFTVDGPVPICLKFTR